MLRHIAQAVGLGTLLAPVAYACGGTTIIEDGSGGASSAQAADNSSSVTSVNNTQVSSSSGGSCTETATAVTSGGFSTFHYTVCLDDLNTPCPADAQTATDVLNDLFSQQCCADGSTCEYLTAVVCGPYASMGDSCCFEIDSQDNGCVTPGRPFQLGAQAVTAAAIPSSDWLDGEPRPNLAGLGGGLGDDERAVLATLWREHALGEHASIASFARFALELLAVGAPAALLDSCQCAAVEEVRHARLAFSIASSFAGEPVGPGPLPLSAQALTTPSLAELAAATVRDGCINETLSTLLLSAQLEQATDPTIRRTLTTMLEDETRHVELAWQALAWALSCGGPEVAVAARRAFAEATPPTISHHDLAGSALCYSPLPSPAQAECIMRQALEEVIAPCASALLAASASAPQRVAADRQHDAALSS